MQLLQCSIFHNLLRNFAALQVLLDMLLLTWGASEDYEMVAKILNSRNSIWIFPIWIFPGAFLFFLEAVIFTTLFRRCLTLFMSTLKYTTLFQCWFDVVPRRDVASTKRQRWNNVEMIAGLRLLQQILNNTHSKIVVIQFYIQIKIQRRDSKPQPFSS